MKEQFEKSPYVQRKIDILTINQLNRDFMFPENVAIRVDASLRRSPLDFGAFAFSRRAGNMSTKVDANGARGVDLTSLVEHRRDALRALYDYLYCSNQSEATVKKIYERYKFLFEWLDDNDHRDAFSNKDCARLAYRKYSEWLYENLLSQKVFAVNTANERQSYFRKILKIHFETDYEHIVRGISKIRHQVSHHRVPAQSEVANFINVMLAVATTFGKVVAEEIEFPFLFKTSLYETYIFPFNGGMADTPYSTITKPYLNYQTGEICTLNELMDKNLKRRLKKSKSLIRKAHITIDQCNSDLRCEQRMRMATMALNAYAVLIQLITGATTSELIQFQYIEALEVERGLLKKELTSIKFRAGGKLTRYPIGGVIGRKILGEYIKLRDWVLNGVECKYLFFRMHRDGSYTGGFGKQHHAFVSQSHHRLRKLFFSKDSSAIGCSLARKYKSLILRELKTPTSVIASVLNHQVSTNESHYTETTSDRSKEEFAKYWKSIRAAADMVVNKKRDEIVDHFSSSVVGHCKAFNHPRPIVEEAPIKPDCATQYGCLFCENYLCHSDEEDTHKLFSFRYVLGELSAHSHNTCHVENMFSELKMRVDAIIEKISSLSESHAQLTINMKRKVFELGELTDFWEHRMARYESMGVVS